MPNVSRIKLEDKHVADPIGIDLDAGKPIATCRLCGKRLYRPVQDIITGLPVLGPWKHRTEAYHHPTRRVVPEIPGQLELFNVI